ncbi:hypothetical protein GQ43DRAFT_444688 [Delitschia confertaspora ATCC 74209]|uniref:T6SS Phospholipase effector Tle1-like catalytic domain-containing protein n=1 Tax=Delitschia confertaspora ATCC 74209 TaxID=1513339 RepID=A0A9P4JGR9_9PLEO|nr:hypothetical protein GQ43DRAFT_444688 [Delitschia confertaspora ATCC 74209]
MDARPRSRSRSRVPHEDPQVGGGGPGTRNGKRLIVACDGTWLNSDTALINGKLSIPSNVTRISRAIKPVSRDGIPQIVYYHFGVGSQGSIVERVVGGATGEGLAEAVREGYSFLANNYAPGDEIFLLGFSRGAFTARSIAGLVGQVGLLTKKALNALPEIFRDVQHAQDPKYIPMNPNVPFPNKPSADDPRYADELERRRMTRLDIPIKAVGVWDTVGSLGTPRIGWLTKVGIQSQESKEMSFYDTKLSRNIENAFQALALDERRSAFSPAVWEKPEGNKTVLRQVWFPGVHSNVGGGRYDDEQLANITLAWMMSQLEPFLDMRDDCLFEEDDENARYYRKSHQDIRPWSFGEIYNSASGVYGLGGGKTRTPGMYHAVDPFTGRTTTRPLRATNEYIHPSARTRLRLAGPGVDDKGLYECRALTDNYKLVVDYTNRDGTAPDVFWKIRSRDLGGVKILPEAPLWRLERELCKLDPETYDYVRRPPATGVNKKGGKRRGKEVEEVRPGPAPGARRRRSLELGPGVGPRRSSVGFAPEPIDPKIRESKERARSMERDRESEIRRVLPHRRKKDEAWWEGEKDRRRSSALP